jgi:hypothetical protein
MFTSILGEIFMLPALDEYEFISGVCGAICGKKQDVKGRVEPVKEKEVYKETQKEVIIPRFHEESIKGKRYRFHNMLS